MDYFEKLAESYTYNGTLSLKAIEDDIVTLNNQIEDWNTALKYSRLTDNVAPLLSRVKEAKKRLYSLEELRKRAMVDGISPDEPMLNMLNVSANSAKEVHEIVTAADNKEPLPQNFDSSNFEAANNQEDTTVSQAEPEYAAPDFKITAGLKEKPSNLKAISKEEWEEVKRTFPSLEKAENVANFAKVSNENIEEVKDKKVSETESEDNFDRFEKYEVEKDVHDLRDTTQTEIRGFYYLTRNEDTVVVTPKDTNTPEEAAVEAPESPETQTTTTNIEERQEPETNMISDTGEIDEANEMAINEEKTTEKEEEITPSDGRFDYMPSFKIVRNAENENPAPYTVIQEEKDKENNIESSMPVDCNGYAPQDIPGDYNAFPNDASIMTTSLYTEERAGYHIPLCNTSLKMVDFNRERIQITFSDVADYGLFVEFVKEWEADRCKLFGKKRRNIFMDVTLNKRGIKNKYRFEFKNCSIKEVGDSDHANSEAYHPCYVIFKYKKVKINILD